jgi:hypothetical protein
LATMDLVKFWAIFLNSSGRLACIGEKLLHLSLFV